MFGMSTETAARDTETVTEKLDVTSLFGVALGAVVVFAGSMVLFAASPAMPVDPLFGVSSGPVSVIANMVIGASIGAAGAAVAIPQLDRVLEPYSS